VCVWGGEGLGFQACIFCLISHDLLHIFCLHVEISVVSKFWLKKKCEGRLYLLLRDIISNEKLLDAFNGLVRYHLTLRPTTNMHLSTKSLIF
jgi:hypothetical protein